MSLLRPQVHEGYYHSLLVAWNGQGREMGSMLVSQIRARVQLRLLVVVLMFNR